MSHQAAHPPLKMGVDLPNAKLGMWLFLGTEIMFFTAFIGSYIVLRLGSPGWPVDPEDTHIHIWAGGVNTFVLICSSVAVVFALEGMKDKKFDVARRWLMLTLLLACVFLGIKSYEYYGKISHDILPGHIPETDRQALQFTVRDLRAATGIDAAQGEVKRLEKAVAERLKKGGNADSLNEQLSAAQETVKEITPFSNMVVALNDRVKAGDITVEEMKHEVEKLHEVENSPFGSVHVPRVIKYGNLFASCYFIMTGFHAIHVLVGMLLFGILLSYGSGLGSQHEVFVENAGLYWHFVDLVWIFLFPLIYIV